MFITPWPHDHGRAALGRAEHQRDQQTVARGALYRRYPGVYSYGPGELSAEAQAMAAVLAAGPGAVLAHLSVATLFRTSRFPAPIPHVLVPVAIGRSTAS